MAAYFIASYRITDPAGYEPYVPSVIPILQAHGCEILAADYASQAIEGAPGEVTDCELFACRRLPSTAVAGSPCAPCRALTRARGYPGGGP